MLIQCTPLLVMRDVRKVSLLYTLTQCTPPVGDEGCMEGEPPVHMLMRDVRSVQACCVHTYTVYTPIGDEGCPEGEPAVHMLTQCTLLLVMRDVRKVKPAVHMLIQCTHLLVMRDVLMEGEPLAVHMSSLHAYTVYTPICDEDVHGR